jgi:hypothetical protein
VVVDVVVAEVVGTVVDSVVVSEVSPGDGLFLTIRGRRRRLSTGPNAADRQADGGIWRWRQEPLLQSTSEPSASA